jgi:hypothetical protein
MTEGTVSYIQTPSTGSPLRSRFIRYNKQGENLWHCINSKSVKSTSNHTSHLPPLFLYSPSLSIYPLINKKCNDHLLPIRTQWSQYQTLSSQWNEVHVVCVHRVYLGSRLLYWFVCSLISLRFHFIYLFVCMFSLSRSWWVSTFDHLKIPYSS